MHTLRDANVFGSFRERLRRERFTLDLEDDIQHSIAVELLEQASSCHCHQEWILECDIEEKSPSSNYCCRHLARDRPATFASIRNFIMRSRHHPRLQITMASGKCCLHNWPKTEIRPLVLQNTDTCDRRAEHVAEIAGLFLHANMTCDAVTALMERDCITSNHTSTICDLLGLDRRRVQGISRYLGMYASIWRRL